MIDSTAIYVSIILNVLLVLASTMNLQKTAYLLIICICIVCILIYGQSILVPFLLGLLLWFIGKGLKATLNRVPFIRTKFPNWLKSCLSVVILLSILALIAEVLSSNINILAQSLDKYQPNVDSIINQLNELFNMDVVKTIRDYSGDLDFATLLQSLLTSVSDIISSAFMILLYALFVFLEEANFRPKLLAIVSGKKQTQNVDLLLDRIGQSISDYFRLKTIVSLITGVLSYIALRFIGVDAAEFWAFLIFILNFIPTIGSLIGTIFPAAFCLFQFGAILPAVLVLSIVGTIQIIVGNLIEPKLMGSSMNISPLVTILSLSLWGAIWGVTGMILSVPITVVLIIILSQFKKTEPIAIMLSEKGNIQREH